MVSKEEIKHGTKLRMPTWYWGHFIKWSDKRDCWIDDKNNIFPSKYVDLKEMELYDESRHSFKASIDIKNSDGIYDLKTTKGISP